jgi:hypothetical protein
MVVGPFRPAMRTLVLVLADAPQASTLTISTSDSSRDVSFFIGFRSSLSLGEIFPQKICKTICFTPSSLL